MQDRFRVRGWSIYDSGYYDNIQNMLFGEEDNMTLLDAISKGLVSEIIPEQCTGLKDKNGKLIYEGDIVKYHVIKKISFPIEKEVLVFKTKKVTFKKGYFAPVFNLDLNDVEIIGNIHENPEMLG